MAHEHYRFGCGNMHEFIRQSLRHGSVVCRSGQQRIGKANRAPPLSRPRVCGFGDLAHLATLHETHRGNDEIIDSVGFHSRERLVERVMMLTTLGKHLRHDTRARPRAVECPVGKRRRELRVDCVDGLRTRIRIRCAEADREQTFHERLP